MADNFGGFFQSQAAFGRPAEYIPRNIELEAQSLALKDIVPKAIKRKLDELDYISGEYHEIDKEAYLETKQLISQQAREFQKRYEANEKPELIIPDMNKFRNNTAAILNIFKDRKNQITTWEDALLKNDKVGRETKEDYMEMTKYNLMKDLNDRGLQTTNLPLPVPVNDINLYEKAAKWVDDQIEEEGKSTMIQQYGKNWYQNPAAMNAFENYKQTEKVSLKWKNPENIKAIIHKNMDLDPEAKDYLDQRVERDIFNEDFKPTFGTEAQESVKQFLPEIIQARTQGYIDDIANTLAITKAGLVTTEEHGIDRDIVSKPKWAYGFDQNSAGQQFTLPIIDSLGPIQKEDIQRLKTLKLDNEGNFELYSTDRTYQGIPMGMGETVTPERQEKEFKELQRKYPDIANISKTRTEFITNLKAALREKDGEKLGGYHYNLPITVKTLYSSYLQKLISGNPLEFKPIIVNEEGQETKDKLTEDDYKLLGKASYTLNPIQGNFTTTVSGKKIKFNIPNEIRNLIQPTMDLYSIGQLTWTTGKTQNFNDNTNKIVTVAREFNPETKQYELTYYKASFGNKKVKFEDMLNIQAEKDLSTTEESIKKKDLLYSTETEEE